MINPLTSLRIFFALFVFLSHLSFLKNDEQYAKLFYSIFNEGFLGVSFFFILSGFILAYNYKEKFLLGKISKKTFYVSRLARIYPIHFFTMLVALILGLISSSDNVKYILEHIFLIQSFFSDQDIYFSLNSPSWSISDEMFFYLLFPFVIFLNKSYKILLFIFFIFLIFILNYKLSDNLKHYWLYISPIIRFSDFLLGILLFDIFERVKKIYAKKESPLIFELFAIFLFIVFFIFHDKIDLGYRYSVYYWIPMSLIILIFSLSKVLYSQNSVSNILSNKYLVWLGEISFCFYLIHLLVIQVMNYIRVKLSLSIDLLLFSIFIFIFTLIASAIAYKFIEKPLNKKVKEYLL
ncbi:acyltransferase [Acinetobacter bereziniae]|uniref:acyltransferase family protein n=1 Tax=Acinetobacter bereziniae TaxID=106648 RepID=UPI0021CDD401|nr:acyltransferase [Acinetobacter bereziniae]MCU4542684.1 acyltransferase [Acinetobacter bereziniae]MCU4626324.1 acyltransferase [Acinetobacter bereziniae]